MSHRRTQRRIASFLATLLAIPSIALLGSAAAASDGREEIEEAQTRAVNLSETHIDKVQYKSTVMSIDQYEAVAQADEAAQNMVIDQSAVGRGYFVAFDNEDELRTYLEDHGLPYLSPESDPRAPYGDLEKATGESKSLAEALPLSVNACVIPNHMGWLYDDTSCAGAQLGVIASEAVPDLGIYGWNNKASSAAFGDCIGSLRGWEFTNYTGDSWSYGGYGIHSTLSGGSNQIDSYKTAASGLC